MLLSEILIQRIKEEGPISFHDYMETALYYPDKGYYTSAQNKIGKTGDFYTSSNLTPAFGAMIGRQLEEMWDLLGKKILPLLNTEQEQVPFVMIS
jgi:SAM-dependent MidA family methyltransferase